MQFHTVLPDRAQVYLLFYKPCSDDPLFNRLVALADGPFCHVEMAFPERYGEEPWEKEVWGSSIYQGETVFFKPKTYRREGYVSYALELSYAQMLRIKTYCRMQAVAQAHFSRMAMYAAYVPMHLYSFQGTFCSKHVTAAMQFALLPEVMHLNPAQVTPSRLYRELARLAQPIVQVVPGKLTRDRSDETGRAMLRQLLLQNSQPQKQAAKPATEYKLIFAPAA